MTYSSIVYDLLTRMYI